jgi:hypothetical protein
MEWKEALPLLQGNTPVSRSAPRQKAARIRPSFRRPCSMASSVFASRPHTVKSKNIKRTGRATVTVIKLDTQRYVTVEHPASIELWRDTSARSERLKDL